MIKRPLPPAVPMLTTGDERYYPGVAHLQFKPEMPGEPALSTAAVSLVERSPTRASLCVYVRAAYRVLRARGE